MVLGGRGFWEGLGVWFVRSVFGFGFDGEELSSEGRYIAVVLFGDTWVLCMWVLVVFWFGVSSLYRVEG